MDTLAVRTQGQISASLSRKWEHHLISACFKDSTWQTDSRTFLNDGTSDEINL